MKIESTPARRRRLFAAVLAALSLLAVGSAAAQEEPADTTAEELAAPSPTAEAAPTVHWPSFRGPGAAGLASGQNLPDSWNGVTGENIRWKTRIPGLAHSSPVVWGDRLYLTSAISSQPDPKFIHGLYGAGWSADDTSVHRFTVYAVDKRTGEIVWERAAHEGEPRSLRHLKASYANSTPVTDGETVVALFGAEGLYAYDTDGNLKWKKDLGDLELGAYNAPGFEWGYAASPILWNGLVIVQCDTQQEDFLLAADLETGETVWKIERDELPSWGTPTVVDGPNGPVLVTNASNWIQGYDPATGKELWRLGGSSKITAPTPFAAGDLVIVASGRAPERPIFAVRPGAGGDVTLAEGERANDAVAWSWTGRGSYMPTPVAVDGRLYVLANHGLVDAYDLATGEEIFRARLEHQGGGFSGSPVAADGKIYLPSEDGDIFVLAAGDELELIATNPMGEILMATPALSEGRMYVRGKDHLFAIGRE